MNYFQTEGFGYVQILELHKKNAEKNQSKGLEMNGKKRKQALMEETLQHTIVSVHHSKKALINQDVMILILK
jgi:hypothetical protein